MKATFKNNQIIFVHNTKDVEIILTKQPHSWFKLEIFYYGYPTLITYVPSCITMSKLVTKINNLITVLES